MAKSNSVVLGLSFGKPANITSNEIIAKRMRMRAERENLPMVADKSIPLNKELNTFFIGSSPQIHIPTLILTDEFAKLAQKHGWDKVIVISQPYYQKRCRRDLQKMFDKYDISCAIVLAVTRLGTDDIWFDKKCTQLWTKIKWLFYLREFILQKSPFIFYKWLSCREN